MSAKPRKQPIVMFGLGQRCCYWKREGPYYCGEFGPGDEALLDAVDMAGNQGLRCCNPSTKGLEPDAPTTARAAVASTKTTAPTLAIQNAYFPKRGRRKLNEITLSRPTRYFRGGVFERVVEFETELVDLRLAATQTSALTVETAATVDDALAVKKPTTLTLSNFSETLAVVVDSPFDRIAPLYPQPEAVWRVISLRSRSLRRRRRDALPRRFGNDQLPFCKTDDLSKRRAPETRVGASRNGDGDEFVGERLRRSRDNLEYDGELRLARFAVRY